MRTLLPLAAGLLLAGCPDDASPPFIAGQTGDASASSSETGGTGVTGTGAMSSGTAGAPTGTTGTADAGGTTAQPDASQTSGGAQPSTIPDAGGMDAGGTTGTPPKQVALPPRNTRFDYQIGGAYTPPAGVGIVSRDRHDAPAPGLYNICYVNGFQTQPDSGTFWSQHLDLVTDDVDQQWGETLLDVSTDDKRRRLAEIEGEWIDQCAADGFDAVEIDNLDSYTRSSSLTPSHAVAFIRLLADRAHAKGLAVAQKNTTDLVSRRAEMGTDFVVAEECDCWNECDVFTDAYDSVLAIEYPSNGCEGGNYRESDFLSSCDDYAGELQRVFRDVQVRPSDRGGYVYATCE